MKLKLTSSLASAAIICLATAASLTSCHNNSGNTVNGVEISEFDINEQILTASQSYLITTGPDSCYLTLSASVNWPVAIGDYDISGLQEAIKDTAFDADSSKNVSIREAIAEYITNAKSYELGDSIIPVDTIRNETEIVANYQSSMEVDVIQFTDRWVSYNVSQSTYMGGAHPNYGSAPFTYDLETGKVLTIESLIGDESYGTLALTIKETLAEQLGVTMEDLDQSLLVNEFPVSRYVYIEDGMIMIHYNPYDILPYSFGSINVALQPIVISDMLTPLAKEMLLD